MRLREALKGSRNYPAAGRAALWLMAGIRLERKMYSGVAGVLQLNFVQPPWVRP
ncbi:MAG TPA: hypothetical protein VGC91_00960 [Pyrinomonadaceae bacterium]